MTGPVIKLYLLDIEGTAAPLSLVTEQLFPYARAHFSRFLSEYAHEDPVRTDLMLLGEENRADTDATRPAYLSGDPLNAALAYLLWLMDRDRKSTALKSLQGKVWKMGFESGALRGELFPDVPRALAHWSKQARVAVYSSGSVDAQRLLFRYSSFGDLTPGISSYFDTRTGPKTVSSSYMTIAKAMQLQSVDLLFFSDAVPELDAARTAGCGTRLVVRPGNPSIGEDHGHTRIESFK
ncbi:MAG TPA: acireductone synthase [Terracidiphilus sp.]|nr:acireductone synthase [Terracidiphilus sp.]